MTMFKKQFALRSLALAALALAAACAQAQTVVVVSASSAQGPMTADQVANVFLGKNTSLTPYDQAAASPIRAEFYHKATGRDPAQVKAAWSRLVFSGKAQMPKELGSSADVKKSVAADPKGIGYIEKAAVDASVKPVFTLD